MDQMQHMTYNESIKCNVKECKYHCNEDNYCTLDEIKVTKHHNKADSVEATDCGSFEMK